MQTSTVVAAAPVPKQTPKTHASRKQLVTKGSIGGGGKRWKTKGDKDTEDLAKNMFGDGLTVGEHNASSKEKEALARLLEAHANSEKPNRRQLT